MLNTMENFLFLILKEIIESDLPFAKQKLVTAWAEIHKEELQANWELCLNRDTLFKINPLQ